MSVLQWAKMEVRWTGRLTAWYPCNTSSISRLMADVAFTLEIRDIVESFYVIPAKLEIQKVNSLGSCIIVARSPWYIPFLNLHNHLASIFKFFWRFSTENVIKYTSYHQMVLVSEENEKEYFYVFSRSRMEEQLVNKNEK